LNRKTICFSKNEQIHDNVIGMYIEKYYYKTDSYLNNFINLFETLPFPFSLAACFIRKLGYKIQ
jgi:hypothetical protein